MAKPDTYYDYFPSAAYQRKKWAPERIPASSLRALAQAEAVAVRQGVLSPNLAQSFLANALVEGWHGGPAMHWQDREEDEWVQEEMAGDPDFQQIGPPGPPRALGVRSTGFRGPTTPMFGADQLGYDTPTTRAKLSAMGLPPGTPGLLRFTEAVDDKGKAYNSKGYRGNYNDANMMAKLAAVILSEKARLYGEQKAIERWNGVGTLAQNHVRKVAEMQKMLNDPINARLMEAYGNMKYSGDAVDLRQIRRSQFSPNLVPLSAIR